MREGDFVLVPTGRVIGQAVWCTARVMEPADSERQKVAKGDKLWWIDVNILSTHLPQMYRESELTVIERPSQVVEHNLDPSCLGYGRVHVFVPTEGIVDCHTCGGSGRLDLAVDVYEVPGGMEARLTPRDPDA